MGTEHYGRKVGVTAVFDCGHHVHLRVPFTLTVEGAAAQISTDQLALRRAVRAHLLTCPASPNPEPE